MSEYNIDSDVIIQLDDGWNRVKKLGIIPFINQIEEEESDQNFNSKEFMMNYDLIFKMCIQRDPDNHSDALYTRYTAMIVEYIANYVAIKLSNHSTNESFLTAWGLAWSRQKLFVQGLSKIFMYLNRFFTDTYGKPRLKTQGFRLFRERIFADKVEKVRGAILDAMRTERRGESTDRHLLKQAVDVFRDLGYHYIVAGAEVGGELRDVSQLNLYIVELEAHIISDASAYYLAQARQWLEQDSCPTYLKKVKEALQAEEERVHAYLDENTKYPLLVEVHAKLLVAHQEQVLGMKTGIQSMLEHNSVADLKLLFELFNYFAGKDESSQAQASQALQPISNAFKKHISDKGVAMIDKVKGIKAGSENHDFVKDLIAFHSQYNEMVKVCFNKHIQFHNALKHAFEDFINKDDRVSRFLARYCNEVLSKNSKVSADNGGNIEDTLDNIVFLYGYFQEKDVFEMKYQTYLAKRLLGKLCASHHHEQQMIAKLKRECGYQWTSKLEGMFKDIENSKELDNKFNSSSDVIGDFKIKFDVSMCTKGYWPTSKAIPYKMPQRLQKLAEKYEMFYVNERSGHKLEWRVDEGAADVSVTFAKDVTHTLNVSTYQMMILLCFNAKKVLSLQEIMDMTGIPFHDLANPLLTMAHPHEERILMKRPPGKALKPDDKFKLNNSYKSLYKRVTIATKEYYVDEKQEENEDRIILRQRRNQMDANIVRIMKTRKELKHVNLVSEVKLQCQARFNPKSSQIKQRIEALIDQEYLKRDDNDRMLYHYLA